MLFGIRPHIYSQRTILSHQPTNAYWSMSLEPQYHKRIFDSTRLS
jgi:hypothetical protein